MPHQFFLSYSRKDLSHLEKIKDDLIQNNLSIWTDERLDPGTPNWQRKIVEELRKSSALILLASPNSNNSDWVNEEISVARKLNIEIFCLWVWGDEEIDTFPLGLFNNQRIDLRKNYSKGINLLISTINKKYLSKEIHKETPRSKKATSHIFINYTPQDQELARKVTAYLIDNGIKVWTDAYREQRTERLTNFSSVWAGDIERAIMNSAAMVTIISSFFERSKWTGREMLYHRSLEKRIYPLLASGRASDIPLYLSDLNYLRIDGDFFERGMQDLVNLIYANHPEVIGN